MHIRSTYTQEKTGTEDTLLRKQLDLGREIAKTLVSDIREKNNKVFFDNDL